MSGSIGPRAICPLAKIDVTDVDLEDLCFDAQQCAEKAIKAVFVFRGEPFPLIHDLEELLQRLVRNGVKVPKFVWDADELSRFAVVTRYPGMDISNYYPDFFVKVSAKEVFIVETKGREDLDVPLKMARLKQWCDDVNSAQQDVRYDFVFVDQESFERFHPKSFADLVKSFCEYKGVTQAT